jgi:perosamine synthetase
MKTTTATIANRGALYDKLKADGIGASVHFIPVHMHPDYRKAFGDRAADYPVANRVFKRSLSLPIYPDMTDAQVDFVARRVLAHAR